MKVAMRLWLWCGVVRGLASTFAMPNTLHLLAQDQVVLASIPWQKAF
jgi:hypothetical protein